MFFKQIFEPRLAQYSYVIGCQGSGEAIVIDPMRDVEQYFEIAKREKFDLVAAADTHIHADYISGLRELAERGVKVYASDEGDEDWKYEWLIDKNYSYQLLKDGDSIQLGKIRITAIHKPGHTPEHLIFSVTDLVSGANEPMGYLTGDFVFVGDVGRPDLLESAAGLKNVMKPAAKTLYRSLAEFKKYPEYHQVWPGHGAGSACGKALGAVPDSTVGYELRYNNSLAQTESEEKFVDFILRDQPEPPLYFARMKRENKMGPKVLGGLPQPARIGPGDLEGLAGNTDLVLIDTRERAEFLAGHVPASIFSPLDKQFNTVAGSYIEEKKPIYLLIEESRVTEAVRDLINVGLDNIVGYLTPDDFLEYKRKQRAVSTMAATSFEKLDPSILSDGTKVLDVRSASEYSQGRIPNSFNIPHMRLLARLGEVPREGRLAVHCSAGGRSVVAAALLQRYGFDVLYVDGDVREWKERGNPWEEQSREKPVGVR
jgi:hydroxyacylglutathione hydrolase